MTQTRKPLTVRQRVRLGIAWLNKRRPDWRTRVNQDELNMADCHWCILGQVYGSYFHARDAGMNFTAAVRLGFTRPTDAPNQYWRSLAKAWKNELRTR